MPVPVRYACLEIRTTCGKCGQPMPLNGLQLEPTCSYCSAPNSVPANRWADFLNDFEEEYDELEDRQGTGGTLMSERTYKYALYRLAPRCDGCKKPLPAVPTSTDGSFACRECGKQHDAQPAPQWLRELCPTATQILCGERETSATASAPQVDQAATKPVVFACPQCGAGLSLTSESERVHSCQYCNADVYIPDELWKRLHPVKEVREWFVRLEGKSAKQIYQERRPNDLAQEKASISRYKSRARMGSLGSIVKMLAFMAGVFAVFGIAIPLGLTAAGVMDAEAAGGITGVVLMLVIFGGIFGGLAVRVFLPRSRSKKGLAALAAKRGWEHKHAEHGMGEIACKIDGFEVEIDPTDIYAIEVDIDDETGMFLHSQPPGWTPDEMCWFSTGDPALDEFFPVRWARPKVVTTIESGQWDFSPVRWFMQRWQGKIARLRIDRDGPAAHLLPGGQSDDSDHRYLEPDQMEPLVDDLVMLGKALHAQATGKPIPQLPA